MASCNVSVSVCSACSNFGLSSSLAFPPRSCSAVFSVYGVVVRPNGIDVELPVPPGVTDRDFWPSTVSVLIATRVWSPTLTWRSTVNVTLAASPASSTEDTWPTLIPETATSLPGVMPPASVKNAS